jgi:hypothetical protein
LLVETYGERIPRATVEAARREDPRWLPARLTPEEAYWYANNLSIYDEFRPDILGWLRTSPGNSIRDLPTRPGPESVWATLLQAADECLSRWLTVLSEPIRQASPSSRLTVGHNDLLLASLPANAALDLISFHAYLPGDDSAPATSADLVASLAGRHGLPGMLEEFGWPTSEHSPDRVASLEGATFRELRRRGLLGGFQWMLTDIVGAEATREGSFGLFTATGEAKPAAAAMKEIASGS